MTEVTEKKKLILAVDFFQELSAFQINTKNAVQTLSRSLDLQIQPVYILSPGQVGLSVEFFSGVKKNYVESSQKAIHTFMKKFGIRNYLPPQVLIEESDSLRSAVQLLVKHAKKSNAETIVVSSQAKKGLQRFMLGSFAETLILHSDVPVFIINPKTKEKLNFKNILFPTDFSSTSKSAFHKFLPLLKKMNSSITIYHKTVIPVPTSEQDIFLIQFLGERKETVKKSGLEWVETAKKFGLKADFLLDEGKGTVIDGVSGHLKKKNSILVITSQSGAVSSVLLGSMTREAIRSSRSGAWVVHPEH